MSEQVEVDVVANDKGTPAWKRQADAVAQYVRELAKIEIEEKKNARAANEASRAYENVHSKIVGQVAGYLQLQSLVGNVIRLRQEEIKLADEAADKQDEVARRFRVQAGLDELGGEEARRNINRIAIRTGATTEDAFGAATALTSTGFAAKEASGTALTATLDLIQAQQLKGKSVNADQLAEAASKYLASQGMEKTGANLQTLAVAIQGLKETPMKITDLEQLAKQGATLRGKIGFKEQIANFAMLLESMDAEKAGTSLREVALHMSTAGGAKDKTNALKTLGLAPEDVDLVGESFADALGKIEGGLKKMPESKRAATLKTLFEGANIAAYSLLAGNQDKVQRYVQQEGDVAGFAADVAVGSSGRNAAKRRLEAEKEVLDAELGAGDQAANTRQAYKNVLKEKGVGMVSRFFKDLEYQALTTAGLSPEQAVRFTAPTGDDFGGTEDYVRATREKLERAQNPREFDAKELKTFLEKATKAVEVLTIEVAKPKAFVPATDPKPPAARPSAAIGGG